MNPNIIFWERSPVITREQNHKPDSLDSYIQQRQPKCRKCCKCNL